jgi:hypothetical protein
LFGCCEADVDAATSFFGKARAAGSVPNLTFGVDVKPNERVSLHHCCSRIGCLAFQQILQRSMQYRGIEFKVVKTRSPAGWMWVVEVSNTEREVGTHRDRDGAIRRAKKFIDDLVGKREQNDG